MKLYKVYAKRLQNNLGNETELIGVYPAKCASEAVSIAMCDYSNSGIYDLNTYFAMEEHNR